MPRSPSLARDAALFRMRRLNRWLIAGAVAGAGLLTDVAAQAFPGHTITRAAGTASTSKTTQTAPATTVHRHHHSGHRALTPARQAPKVVEPVAGASSTPASAPATSAPATSAPAPVQSAPVQPAPVQVAPAPAPTPVVSGGS